MIKAVIFDLWQTLIYSDWDFGRKVMEALELSIQKEDELWEALEKDWMMHSFESIEESAKHACAVLGIKDKDKVKKFAELYSEDRKHIKPYSDVLSEIRKLRKTYKIGMLSNTENFVIPILENTGFLDNFDATFFSCDHKKLKPDEAFFHAILKVLGTQPGETVMIGDSMKNDIIPARQLGMHAILIDRNSRHQEVDNRITTLDGLEKIIEKM